MGQAAHAQGYVGYTDFHWFRHYSSRHFSQVAWWRPRATTPLSLPDGTPFFFLVSIQDSTQSTQQRLTLWSLGLTK
jgi:hypothetical protein